MINSGEYLIIKMAITTSWDVKQLKYRTSDGYVERVHWTVEASETVGTTTYTASGYGTRPFEIEEKDETFVELADLTKEQVLQWVWDVEGEDELARIHAELAKKLSIAKGEDQDETVGLPDGW